MSELLDQIEQYYQAGVTDGLPVIPPTLDKYKEMVTAIGYPEEHVLGTIQPSGVEVRVKEIAINAIMAGCLPEYGPVVFAAVKAFLQEQFTPWGVACSTKGGAPLIIVNGPIRDEIGMNYRGNVFGSGARANATIGRALRLVLQNVCRAKSPDVDKAVLGHGGKYTYCIAEDEEGSEWEPLHVERGYQLDDSAVTLMGLEAPRQVSIVTDSGEAILYTLADTIASVGLFGGGILSKSEEKGNNYLLVIAKEHREILNKEGWTKNKIRDYIIEHAVLTPERLKPAGYDVKEPVPLIKKRENIYIVAAGGGGGFFSAVVPGWTWMSEPVTVKVERKL